jgi:NitT/TauT family transport system ATP-binding protein
MMALCVRLESVSHTYSTESGEISALSHIDLSVKSGQFVGIIGPSGCGKSTLLRVIAGLIRPTSGQVRVLGGRPSEVAKQGLLGFVFQDPTLFPWRTASENVRLPLELLDADVKKVPHLDDRVEALLKRMGLADFTSSYPDELSGGMRSRVAIARALMTSPKLMLMDEPFGALDELTAHDISLQLTAVMSETHRTVIMVTHNIGQATFLADRIIVLSKRPGTIIDEIGIPTPPPRKTTFLDDPVFAATVSRIRGALLSD